MNQGIAVRSRVITFSFKDNFIHRLVNYIEEHFLTGKDDLSHLAIIFGGRRPALFVQRALANRLGKSFFPPHFWTMDEWMDYIVAQKEDFTSPSDLEQVYCLFQLAQKETPEILKGRERFAQFLPWAHEILAFMDQLDLEDVASSALRHVEANAGIGYSVPEDINRLLRHMIRLRDAYHARMQQEHSYTRGYRYLRAAQVIPEISFAKMDQILFCNLFYLHRTEEKILKHLLARNLATLILQGDERKWPVMKHLAERLGVTIREAENIPEPTFDLKLYAGFDGQSQVGVVSTILKKIPESERDRTVIVLTQPAHLMPLLTHCAGQIKEFNISMGYPLKRSSLDALLDLVFKAQASHRREGYYAKDYLKVMRHPFVKNLKMSLDGAVTRVLVHRIEEILMGKIRTEISGSLFVDLKDILKCDALYESAQGTLKRMGRNVTRSQLSEVVEDLHELMFYDWEEIKTFKDFALIVGHFVETLRQKSFLGQYPLNLRIAERIQDFTEGCLHGSYREEIFSSEDLFKIFMDQLEHAFVPFHGSPLKGLQILGLFETRSLHFDHVILLDVNEGILPRLRIYEPLIPREVMISLNLDRLELEEEIQRYQFMRLISSAKGVHLVFQESRDTEKSRLVEELIWQRQKKEGNLKADSITRPRFTVRVTSTEVRFPKTPQMIAFLKQMTYSASSLNSYLRSPLEFYRQYVLGLKAEEDLLDEPENRQVGTFIHELLEETFRRFIGRRPIITPAFRRYFQRALDRKFQSELGKAMKSDAFLLKKVLDVRLRRFLDQEANLKMRSVEKILFLEKRFVETLPFSCGPVKFVYQMDRIEEREDGSVWILDYKTGSADPMPRGIDVIEQMEMSRATIAESVRSFQMPLYFYYLDRYYQERSVNAAFYNLRSLELKAFVNEGKSVDRQRIHQAFLRPLEFILSEILDPAAPFQEASCIVR